MESCILHIKLIDDSFGDKQDIEEILLLEADLNRQLSLREAGEVASVERGNGIAEIIIVGESADVIAEVIWECVSVESLPIGSLIKQCKEVNGVIQSVVVFSK